MRKHFLILMLLALLPLAGFSAPVMEEVEVRVYGGEQHFTYGTAYTVPEAVVPGMLVFMPYGLDSDVQTAVCEKLKFTWTGDPLTTTSDAATYGFTVSLVNAGQREFFWPSGELEPQTGDTHHYVITVQDPDGSFIIDKATAPIATVAPAIKTEDLFYNGQEQDLLESKGTVADGFELEFSVDGGEWSTEGAKVTNANLTGYTVTYRTKAKPNYNASASADLTAKVVGKGTVTLNPFTVVADGPYNGLEKQLITAAATTDFGNPTIKYQVQYRPTAQSATAWNNFPWSTKRTDINHNDFKRRLAGQYRIMALIEGDANVNDVSSSKVIVTINQAPLTVKTDDKVKTYGEDDPAFTVTYDGFQNNENAGDLIAAGELTAPVLERADNTNNNVADGPYEISVTTLPTATNYVIEEDVPNRGHLTINPRELDLTSNEFEFTLAGTEFTFTGHEITTVVSSAEFKNVAMVYPNDYTFVTTNNVHVGDANVVITGQGNFKGSVIKPFTITPKPVWIKPANAEKLYGTADPAPLTTYTIVDANYVPASGDDPATEGAVIEGATLYGTVNFTRVDGQNVGEYVITVSGYEPSTNPTEIDDYAPQITGSLYASKFTIKPNGDGLVLKFKTGTTATKVYGEANPAWGLDDLEVVSGLIAPDTWETVKPTMSAPDFAIASENVNAENNKVTVSNLGSTNYPNVTVQDFAFEVTARPIAVEVKPQTVNFMADLAQGTDDALWEITTTDWNGNSGDDKADLNLVLQYVNNPASYAPDGTYTEAIKAVIDNPNYSLTDACVWGTLHVNSEAAFVLSNLDENLDTKLIAVDNTDYDVKMGNMPLNKKEWYAVVLPFATTPKELVEKLGSFLIVNKISSSTKDAAGKVTVNFAMEWDEIAAGEPFLIKTADATNWDETVTNPFTGKTLVHAITDKGTDFATLTGTYKADEILWWGKETDGTTPDANAKYRWLCHSGAKKYKYEGDAFVEDGTYGDAAVMPYEASNNNWKNCKTNPHKLMPMEAYIILDPSATSARILVEDFENGVTSIKSLSADDINGLKTSEGWYTIDGIRLQGAPSQKGIYINNGKKVVLK